jgi:KDO2-lipid IV(A) lauroyltransferase
VALLIDQDARREGIFVDFMGSPASTHTSVARLSLATGSPIAFVYSVPEPRGLRFRVEITDVVRPRPDADEDTEIFRMTQRLTSDLERVIRKYPEHWLWTQKRWKTYPGKFERGKRPRRGILHPDREPTPSPALRS